jgi:hypothetical protein
MFQWTRSGGAAAQVDRLAERQSVRFSIEFFRSIPLKIAGTAQMLRGIW